jgi:hypothetical protein
VTAGDSRSTAFSYRRQRLDGSAPDARGAIAAVVGVYAANPSGPLSILARAPAATADQILALERDGMVVRGRAMRTSSFVVPAETAPLVRAATAQPVERFAWMLRAARVSAEAFPAARSAVLAAASEPLTARELRARTDLGDVDIGTLLSYLALRGDLVSLGARSVTSSAGRYRAREAWDAQARDAWAAEAPQARAAQPAATGPGRDEARAWLAGEYLRAFGPARIQDFAWWSGVAPTSAASALAAQDTVDVGDGLLLAAGDLPAYESAPPLRYDDLALVPKWDPWTMGYPMDGRSRFVDRDVHDRIYDGDGNAMGAILVAGRAVGAWTQRGVGGRMEAGLDPFDRWPARLRESVETRLRAAAAFLGYREVRVREVPTIIPDRPRVRRPTP